MKGLTGPLRGYSATDPRVIAIFNDKPTRLMTDSLIGSPLGKSVQKQTYLRRIALQVHSPVKLFQNRGQFFCISTFGESAW